METLKVLNTSVAVESIRPIDLDRAFDDAWNSAAHSRQVFRALWDRYVEAMQGDAKPAEFAEWMRARAEYRFNSDRTAMVRKYHEYHGQLPVRFTDCPEMAGTQSAFTSARQACAYHASGVTFKIAKEEGSKTTVQRAFDGYGSRFEIDSSKYRAESGEAETARAKGANKNAHAVAAASVPGAEDGATALETVASSETMARTTVLALLKEHPAVFNDPLVIKRILAEWKKEAGRDAKSAAARALKKAAA